MPLHTISENIFFKFLVLFLATGINSQTASDDFQQPHRFGSCGSSSYCTPIRRCSSLRDGWKRRGVGITCGPGSGPHRMVCCPRTFAEEIQVRQTKRPMSTTPIPPPKGNSEDCGLSQGIDWFQEHAMDDTDALEATWPWMVAIRIRKRAGPFEPWCSGFLIDKLHVLLAAHCFERHDEARNFTARIGSDDQDLADEYPISKITKHEDYKSGSFYHDIALLTLSRQVKFSNFVPVCLPDDRIAAMDLTGWGTTILGWGRDGRPDLPAGSTLKQLDNVPIVSIRECEQIFNEGFPLFKKRFPQGITEKMICAGQTEAARDACGGESGGPMMILYKKRWIAVGITSWGHACGMPGVPSGYTRISSYMDWIRQNTENDLNPILTELQQR